MRILIADDDDAYRALLRAALSTLDRVHAVSEAVNGHDAVALASVVMPDAVLLDVDMPLMDGFAAAVAIRELVPDVRLAVHTGALVDEHRSRARELDLLLADKIDVHATLDALTGLPPDQRAVVTSDAGSDARCARASRAT
jgi:DNA-binding NarL/FixJ family response regulator